MSVHPARLCFPQIGLTLAAVQINVKCDQIPVPMNLQRSKLAGICRNFFGPGMFGALFLAMSFIPAHAGDSLPATNPTTDHSSKSQPEISVSKAEPGVTNGLGCWMWDKVTFDKQTVRFWQSFEVPKTNPVVHAELRIAADNAYRVWLDGQELGSGSDWRTLSIYDLEGTLGPGAHVLAVEGFNDNDQAGIILGMRLETANGQVMQIHSDRTWRIVPNSERGWEKMLDPDPNWPNAAFAINFGRVPWWTIPTSVLRIHHGTLPKPVPVWQSQGFQVGLFLVCGIAVVICLYLLIQLVIQSKAHRLVQAERDRIARDIHDDLGSKLTQLLLTGEVAQIESNAHGTSLSQMCDGARNILATIDEVVWIVNSQHDNLEDFVIYVCKYVQNFLDSSSIRCRFDMPPEFPAKDLSQFTRRNLFLAIKEALNNAVKHSKATELTMHIDLNGPSLNVIVTDNGCGFDVTAASQKRNGVTNMKLRMAEIGGDCQVISQKGEGCRISFHVPLKQPSFLKSLFQSQDSASPAARFSSQHEDISLPKKAVEK